LLAVLQEGEEQHQGLVLKTTTEEEDEKHESDVREVRWGGVARCVCGAVNGVALWCCGPQCGLHAPFHGAALRCNHKQALMCVHAIS
jgi:hypothetical protein